VAVFVHTVDHNSDFHHQLAFTIVLNHHHPHFF